MPARRDLLRTGGAAALLAVAGCVQGFAADSEDGTATDETTATDDGPTATDDGPTTTTGDADTGDTDTADGDPVSIAVETEDGERTLVTDSEISVAGDVREAGSASPFQLPVTIGEDGQDSFLDGLERAGAFDAPDEHELRIYHGEELVYGARLGQELIHVLESGEWNGSFVIPFESREAAERAREQIADD